MVKEVHQLAKLGVWLVDLSSGSVSVHSRYKSLFGLDVESKQHLDTIHMDLKDLVLSKSNEMFFLARSGILRYKNRLCVPNVNDLSTYILAEAHVSKYSINPGATKMYHDLKEFY